MLAYGEEGDLHPDSHLYVANDTFVNDLGRGAAMLIGAEVRTPLLAENDISTGSPVFVAQRGAHLRHNCVTGNARFVNPGRFDYRLAETSPCRRVGRRPAAAQGFSLVPRFQYAGVAGHVRRTDGGAIAGAFGT
jgi:hypothetical protein